MNIRFSDIRNKLKEAGVDNEALVSAMMDSFERTTSEIQRSFEDSTEELKASISANKGGSGIPAWVWGLLGASVLANVVLGVFLQNSVNQIRVATARIPEIQAVADDIKKLTALEGRFATAFTANETAIRDLSEAVRRFQQSSDGILRTSIEMAENSAGIQREIRQVKIGLQQLQDTGPTQAESK